MSCQRSHPWKSDHQPGEGREVPGTTAAWAGVEMADGGRGRPESPGVVTALPGCCRCFLTTEIRTASASGPYGALPGSSSSSLRASPSHSKAGRTREAEGQTLRFCFSSPRDAPGAFISWQVYQGPRPLPGKIARVLGHHMLSI